MTPPCIVAVLKKHNVSADIFSFIPRRLKAIFFIREKKDVFFFLFYLEKKELFLFFPGIHLTRTEKNGSSETSIFY